MNMNIISLRNKKIKAVVAAGLFSISIASTVSCASGQSTRFSRLATNIQRFGSTSQQFLNAHVLTNANKNKAGDFLKKHKKALIGSSCLFLTARVAVKRDFFALVALYSIFAAICYKKRLLGIQGLEEAARFYGTSGYRLGQIVV
jgi:hypothetical protein